MTVSRRTFIALIPSLLLAGKAHAARDIGPEWVTGIIPDKPFDIQLTNLRMIPPQYRRQPVSYDSAEKAGTLIVDARNRYLYVIETGRRALRFGISVGREGAAWHGTAVVGRKAKWPTWTPTQNMRRRNPKLPVQMKGGPENPLGARALYLFQNGRDTLYRIHGTNEPWSIGKAASSGCIRMLNEDVFELYGSVQNGAKVIVK